MRKLGFGCMRLPMRSGNMEMNREVDYEQFNQMIDKFFEAGFCYFGGENQTHWYIFS